MTARMPSGSGLDRGEECPRYLTLPAYDTEGKFASKGTSFHAYKSRILNGTDTQTALSMVPDEYTEYCASASIGDSIADLDIKYVEPAYAYDFDTGAVRWLGNNIGRKYNARPSEICCSLDVVGWSVASQRFVYADWKTGRPTRKARDSLQMGFGILCVAKTRGLDIELHDWEVRLIYISDSGDPYVDTHVFLGIELLDIEARVMAIVEAARSESPKLKMGDWCRYCPAMLACPAYRDAVSLFTGVVDPQLDDLGAAYAEATRLLDAATLVTEMAKRQAEQTPLKVAPGKVLAPSFSRPRRFNRKAALDALSNAGIDVEQFFYREEQVSLRVQNE